MSHFLVGIIIPPGVVRDLRVEQVVEGLMAPFDENIEIPAYKEECWCVGCAARMEVDEQVGKEFGTWDEMRAAFHKEPKYKSLGYPGKDATPEQIAAWEKNEIFRQEAWDKIIAPKEKRKTELLTAHPMKEAPDKDCDDCDGTGLAETTRNPDGNWDWYRIGGRWDGWITDAGDLPGSDGFNFGEKYTSLARNMTPVEKILKSFSNKETAKIPFAILTPNGEWIESGKMGWWATVSDEKDQRIWKKEVKKIFTKYKDHYVVAVDCHI